MKRVIIAALALMGFSAASFAQAAPPVKKNESSKMQGVSKATDKKDVGKVVPMNKTTRQTPPVVKNAPTTSSENKVVHKPVVKTQPVATTAEANVAGPRKKDGTADMRYNANKGVAKNAGAVHLKKDGTSDNRFRENKKHS